MSLAEAAPAAARGDGGQPWAVRTTGQGPAVVWIHGYTMDSRIFGDIWAMIPGFRHIGLDLPGHGGSPDMTSSTTMAGLAAGVADILRREQADRLVAVSMGTMVAFEVAIRRLAPLAKLAVVAPALVGMPAAPGTAVQYRTMTGLRRIGLSSAVVDVWMSPKSGIYAGISRFPARYQRLREVIRGHRFTELDFGGPTAFYRDAQSSADLPGSAAELLVLAGDEDMPEFRDLCASLGRDVAGTRVMTLPGAGHLPLLEFPEVAAPLLAQFLAAPG